MDQSTKSEHGSSAWFSFTQTQNMSNHFLRWWVDQSKTRQEHVTTFTGDQVVFDGMVDDLGAAWSTTVWDGIKKEHPGKWDVQLEMMVVLMMMVSMMNDDLKVIMIMMEVIIMIARVIMMMIIIVMVIYD